MPRLSSIKFTLLLSIVLGVVAFSSVHASSPPNLSPVSPSTPISFFVGANETFTAQVTDPDCDLQGSEWYVDHQRVVNSYYSGCSATVSSNNLVLGRLGPGNHLVEVNAFDTQGQYSDSPVAWDVTVRYQVVKNHFLDQPPYAYWSQSDCSSPLHSGINSVIYECISDAQTGKMLVGGGISVGPGTGAASVVAHALVSDEFKVLRSSMYQLSWSFDLQGVILKESECAVAFSSVEASLTVDVTLFGPDGIVWDSGQIMAYDDSVECTGFVIVPQTVQEVHPLIGEVTTPQIGLHPLGECSGCVYSWQAQATLFVRGHATGAGAARYELWFKPRTLQTQYYDKWAKLTQLRVDDIYPDTVPPTTTCLPSGIEANGWYSSGVSVTCSVADNPSGNAPTGTPYAYGVNQTYYKIDDQQDWIAYASPFTIDSEGKHAFYFYSIDYADNREDRQTRNVWIDTTPPTGTALHINSNAQYTTSTAVTLTASASDPGGDSGSGVWQMRFGNSGIGGTTWNDWQAYSTSPVSWNLLPGDGTDTVCAQFKDYSGNLSPEIGSCAEIILDTTPPTTPNPSGPEGSTNDCTPMFTWTASVDGGSGLAKYYWKVDGGDETPTTGISVTLPCESNGQHTFYAKAVDKTGNPSDWGSYVFSIDTIAPTAKAGSSQTVAKGTSVTLDGSASSDNVRIVSYEWDFGDGSVGTGQTVTHLYADTGAYRVTLTVKDAAGNSETATTTVTVNPLPNPTSPQLLMPTYTALYLVVGLVGVVVTLTAFILILRRHAKKT